MLAGDVQHIQLRDLGLSNFCRSLSGEKWLMVLPLLARCASAGAHGVQQAPVMPVSRVSGNCGELIGQGIGKTWSHAGNRLSSPITEHRIFLQ